ncbi:MAG: [FeFe] hydrogenase H-cluster radical SAM maturase HydE, partial [Lachnospiraceae bacterium]|nr:[FeFe] hydrogenase H-cluster radical SAM maturase HydE [Lachnospiraceae bacterium]
MDRRERELIEKLSDKGSLSKEEYEQLIVLRDDEAKDLLALLATQKRKAIFGHAIYTRGLIEIS